MSKSKERTIKYITKDEFCKAIHTRPDCWIFKKCEGKNPTFWVDKEEDREDWYYMDNRIDTIYTFKDMPKYGEVWISQMDRNTGELFAGGFWGTWTQYD